MINVDADPDVKPDVVHDITEKLPFEANSIDMVYLLHTIEHLTEGKQVKLLLDIRRVLKDEGKVIISYPEFTKVAQNYIDNKCDDRAFWKATLYGRQLTDTDYHVSLMDTRYFTQLLLSLRFEVLATKPEEKEDFNTLVIACKSNKLLTREQIVANEIFGDN